MLNSKERFVEDLFGNNLLSSEEFKETFNENLRMIR